MVITQRRIITRTKGTGSRVNIKKTPSLPPRSPARSHVYTMFTCGLLRWPCGLLHWPCGLLRWPLSAEVQILDCVHHSSPTAWLTEINRCRVSIKETSFISRKLYSPSLPLSLSHVAHLTPTMTIIISCQTVLSVRGTIWSVITTIILLGHCSVY